MNNQIITVLDKIGEAYQDKIQKGSRHYLEVSIGKQAETLGLNDIKKKYKDTYVIVPLKAPQKGMKVRIDGRTFVDYAEYKSGIAVPGYLAKQAGRAFKAFTPQDSMICNYT